MTQLSLDLPSRSGRIDDRAAAIVTEAIMASLRPGTPVPFRQILSASCMGRHGAKARLEMFDGRKAVFECDLWIDAPGAYRHRWSEMEGGSSHYCSKSKMWVRVQVEERVAA